LARSSPFASRLLIIQCFHNENSAKCVLPRFIIIFLQLQNTFSHKLCWNQHSNDLRSYGIKTKYLLLFFHLSFFVVLFICRRSYLLKPRVACTLSAVADVNFQQTCFSFRGFSQACVFSPPICVYYAACTSWWFVLKRLFSPLRIYHRGGMFPC